MQENDFETIISKWRRLSAAEQAEKRAQLASMSGDSSQQTFKKKEDESNLILPEQSGTTTVSVGVGMGAVAAAEFLPDIDNKNDEEKQDLIKRETEETKDAAGDTNNDHKDYLEINETVIKNKSENSKLGDNVDSVFLRSPPPHKTGSNISTPDNEEEDCGVKCLYYMLQCCDCSIIERQQCIWANEHGG